MAAALVRSAVDAPTARAWLAAIDAHPAWLRREGAGFDRYSSSLQVSAVPGLDLAAIAGTLLQCHAGPSCRAGLGGQPVVAIERCWVRRQYAPDRAPPTHAPHAWHQDGALCFDFLAAAGSPRVDMPLAMTTSWIALTACGDDAPGLELVVHDGGRLLGLDEITESAIRQRHAAADFWRPTMQAGDALVFDGGVLHRTHVTPAMRADRTSLEIRFFDAGRIDERLRNDHFISVH